MEAIKENSQCAPGSKEHDFTCYTSQSLVKMRNLWNARHSDDTIDSDEPKVIWRHLKGKLGSVCDSEMCWMNQQFMKNGLSEEMRYFTFAPKAPSSWKKNPKTWLTSTDIAGVMKQFENTYPSFAFLGPSPIDYDHHYQDGTCVWQDICEFDLKNMIRKGKTKIGMIFNLDKHNQSGSHWVAKFVDIANGYVMYIDSTGENIPARLKKLQKKIVQQGVDMTPSLDLKEIVSRKEHQNGNTECGMYTLYFISGLLKGSLNPDLIQSKRFTDKDMLSLREEFFNLPR
jgi:hypothetical protein